MSKVSLKEETASILILTKLSSTYCLGGTVQARNNVSCMAKLRNIGKTCTRYECFSCDWLSSDEVLMWCLQVALRLLLEADQRPVGLAEE